MRSNPININCFPTPQAISRKQTKRKGDVANDLDEEVFVAFDRCGEGGELRIVTDPEEIKNIEREEEERKRNVS